MSARYRAYWALVELVLGGAALLGAVASWSRTRSTVAVAPVADGLPATTSVVYHPHLLVLTLLLATFAGVLAVVGTAKLRSTQRNSLDVQSN